jgi:hypothetical protein
MTITTIADLKTHMGLLEDEATDELLQQKLNAAEAWVAGYVGQDFTDLDTLPATVTEAVLRLAADLYENREATLVGVSAETLPFGVVELLASVRNWTF